MLWAGVSLLSHYSDLYISVVLVHTWPLKMMCTMHTFCAGQRIFFLNQLWFRWFWSLPEGTITHFLGSKEQLEASFYIFLSSMHF